ncbi:MAG: DUF4136 domain-containing protein [Myxococcales bacterium]|nr:DUF4136 domain-containing protein [Myxococcales bacterium]
MCTLSRFAARGCVAALTACGLVLLVGCAHLKIRSDYDSEVDFSQFRSFAWLDPPVKAETAESPAEDLVDPFAKNSLLDKRVRKAVERELLARGYEMANGSEPEFEIQYHVVLRERTKIRSYPTVYGGYYGYPYGYGGSIGSVSSYDYQEGTLILDVIDARTQQIAWRGWAVGINREGYYTDAKVAEIVKRVLDRFPPERREADE